MTRIIDGDLALEEQVSEETADELDLAVAERLLARLLLRYWDDERRKSPGSRTAEEVS